MHNSFSDSPSNMVFNCFTLDATFHDRNFLSAFAAIWLTLSFLPVISLLFCLIVIFAALLAFFVFWAGTSSPAFLWENWFLHEFFIGYSLPAVIQSRSISHRLWLYGANLLLLCVVTLFSAAVRVTVSTERMIIVPIEKQESLVILTYVVSLLQALDVFMCFSGVWRRKIGLVFIYWNIFILLIILDFVFTILWVIRFQHVHQTLPHFLFNQVRNKFSRSNAACAVWDNIQLEFNCCGVYSYNDYKKVRYWCDQDLANGTNLPRSCCENEFVQCNSTVLYSGTFDEEDDGPEGTKTSSWSADDLPAQIAARLVPDLLRRPGCKNHLLQWLHDGGTNWFILAYCTVILVKIVLCIVLKNEIREFACEIDLIHQNSTASSSGDALDRAFSVEATPFMGQIEEEGVHRYQKRCPQCSQI